MRTRGRLTPRLPHPCKRSHCQFFIRLENGELKTQVANWEAQLKEAEALTATALEEKVRAQEDWDKANAISQKFHDFVEHSGNVVNKARLYDEMAGQLGVSPAPKVIRCLVHYNVKMERLLKEMQALLQPAEH